MNRAEGLAREDATEALAARVRPADLARDRRLPVLPALAGLLPGGGLRRGTTVAVGAAAGATGATSLALALAAGPSQAGSWVAAVGLGSLGLVAGAGMGVALERLVLVSDPHDRPGWAPVVAALVDGFDIVLVAGGSPGRAATDGPGPAGGDSLGGGPAGAGTAVGDGAGLGVGRATAGGRRSRVRPADARRLVARVRERESVLVVVGDDLPGERSHVRLTVTAAAWEGLEAGAGHLRGRRVTVESGGRGESARPRRREMWLPDGVGGVAAIEPLAEPIPLHAQATGA